MDVYEWVQLLFDMVSPPDPAMESSRKSTCPRLGVPFFQQGSAQEVLAQVFAALRELYTGHGSWQAQREFCIEAIVYQMDLSHIY